MKLSRSWFLGIVVALVSDRITKLLAIAYTTPILNQKGAWSLGGNLNWSLTALMLLLLLIWWSKKASPSSQLWLGLMIGAGMGNLLDRVVYGGVIDFIYYPFLSVSGNLADIWLTVAAVGLVFTERRRV